MYYVPYNNNLKLLSRKLRTTSTIGEILLWKQLRAKSMMGYQYLDDICRQNELEELKINFLRFMEMDVRKDMLGVLRVIENYINDVTPPP